MKEKTKKAKAKKEHPAVIQAKDLLRLTKKAIKDGQVICYSHHVELILKLIIKAK